MYVYKNLTHRDFDKMVNISQTTFSNAISWMKINVYGLVCSQGVNNYKLALVQLLALCLTGYKSLPEPGMTIVH